MNVKCQKDLFLRNEKIIELLEGFADRARELGNDRCSAILGLNQMRPLLGSRNAWPFLDANRH